MINHYPVPVGAVHSCWNALLPQIASACAESHGQCTPDWVKASYGKSNIGALLTYKDEEPIGISIYENMLMDNGSNVLCMFTNTYRDDFYGHHERVGYELAQKNGCNHLIVNNINLIEVVSNDQC